MNIRYAIAFFAVLLLTAYIAPAIESTALAALVGLLGLAIMIFCFFKGRLWRDIE